MKPLAPISNTARLGLGILFFVFFFAAWGYATLGGYVSKTFLADPLTMIEEGWLLLTKHGFIVDIGITIWRVVGGFVLAALVAIRVGILVGAYKPIEAFFEPFVSFARYLPASAFIPLLILWAGLGELQKLLVIFIGSVFQIVLMVAVAGASVRRDLVEAALTLGARDRGIPARAGVPGPAPEVAQSLSPRLGLDLRDRRRADRLVLRHRPHDHRQPSAARHRADHLRHHRDRRDRPDLRFPVQVGKPQAVPLEPRVSKLAIEGVSRIFPPVRRGTPTRALEPTTLAVADNDFVTILGPSGCGQSTLLRLIA